MNSDEKLKELGSRLDVSEEEITEIRKSKWYRVNPVIYIVLGVIGVLSSFQGNIIGKDVGTYPFRIFLGPFTIITTENNNNKRKVIGVVIITVSIALICFLIGYLNGYGNASVSGPTTKVINGTTYTIGTEYGVWSL